MSIPEWREPEDSPLVWDDSAKADPAEDMRRLVENMKATPRLPQPMAPIMSIENFNFIKEHPRSPCCGAEWFLEGYANACSGCLLPVAAVRAKMAKGEP
jgi:hypothetical protein